MTSGADVERQKSNLLCSTIGLTFAPNLAPGLGQKSRVRAHGSKSLPVLAYPLAQGSKSWPLALPLFPLKEIMPSFAAAVPLLALAEWSKALSHAFSAHEGPGSSQGRCRLETIFLFFPLLSFQHGASKMKTACLLSLRARSDCPRPNQKSRWCPAGPLQKF